MATVHLEYTSGLRTTMTHLQSGSIVITDAPTDNKGKGEAFSPTDLVAAALASCMLTTMGIAGQEHGFVLDGAKASVTKIMASSPRRIAEVQILIDFPDIAYSEKQKAIMQKIAASCPVALSLNPKLKQSVQLNYKY